MQDSMKEKLKALVMRNEDITRELMAPGAADDLKHYRALMKEQNELVPVVETYTEYEKQEKNMDDALSMMDGESDPEMKVQLKGLFDEFGAWLNGYDYEKLYEFDTANYQKEVDAKEAAKAAVGK